MSVKRIALLLLGIALACQVCAQTSDTLPPTVLSWVEDRVEHAAKAGEPSIRFSYDATNVSTGDVIVTKIQPSCGCTLVDAPPLPWTIVSGAKASIPLNIDLRGKRGLLAKEVTLDTSHGRKVLRFRIQIPPGAPMLSPVAEFRERNLKIAAGDSQAIFKNTCANCHASPARGRMGRELYQAACAICHNSPNRAEMVPALDNLQHPTDLGFWEQAISSGKPGTLMPAFAASKGGPLTPEQVASLAQYLADTISSKQATGISGAR